MSPSVILDKITVITEVWRAHLFSPLLKLCQLLGINAHGVSSLRFALAALFPFLILSRPVLTWWLIGISIFLDAFDGCVARDQKTASDRGKFVDLFVDQLTYIFLCLGLMRLLPEFAFVLAAAMIAIPTLYLIGLVRLNETKSSDWLIRPQVRLTVYKVVFLVIVIGRLSGLWDNETVGVLLWTLVTVSALHLLWHYLAFILKKN